MLIYSLPISLSFSLFPTKDYLLGSDKVILPTISLIFQKREQRPKFFKTPCLKFTPAEGIPGPWSPALLLWASLQHSLVRTASELLARKPREVFSSFLLLSQFPYFVTFNQADSICVIILVRLSLPLKNCLGIWAWADWQAGKHFLSTAY